jgi:hypothetical protein
MIGKPRRGMHRIYRISWRRLKTRSAQKAAARRSDCHWLRDSQTTDGRGAAVACSIVSESKSDRAKPLTIHVTHSMNRVFAGDVRFASGDIKI